MELHDGQDRLIIDAEIRPPMADAPFDAYRYKRGVRPDYDTFVRVYGFSYTVVLRIRRFMQFKLIERF